MVGVVIKKVNKSIFEVNVRIKWHYNIAIFCIKRGMLSQWRET